MTRKEHFGRIRIDEGGPINPISGVWMIPGFGNTGVVETDEGMIVVDIPVRGYVKKSMGMLRDISKSPIHSVFLTHGHQDHACHLGYLFEEAKQNDYPLPRVIAQRNILKRFEKYRMLWSFHDHINRIQFGVPEGITAFPLPEHNPDVVFDQTMSTRVGGIDFHAFHGLGETDDHLWVWVPEKKTVFAGDFVIWSFPNVGNPFKVQRYTLEWAETLESIIAREPQVLVPGHGPVIEGYELIREILLKFSSALRYLHEEVIQRLNKGMSYEDILYDITLPDDMLDSEFLAPRYGCPTFVVHGILRQYTGWYDGNPSNLFPPKSAEVAKEVAGLVGKEALIEHARQLKDEGREEMALKFLDMALAAEASPDEKREMYDLRKELLDTLGHRAGSFIAKNIYFRARDQERDAVEE